MFPLFQFHCSTVTSAPIAFLQRIHDIKIDKFPLLENGRGSLNGSLLCCPYLALPGNRTRTSAVKARFHKFAAGNKFGKGLLCQRGDGALIPAAHFDEDRFGIAFIFIHISFLLRKSSGVDRII